MRIMETMQDILIREKLNSLDTLPVGYALWLDSKWELLRAGKPEKKRKPIYFWYAAAASLLLLLGFGVTFWQTEKPAAEKAIAKQEIQAGKITPEIPVQNTTAPDNKPEKQAIASTEIAPKNDGVKSPKTI